MDNRYPRKPPTNTLELQCQMTWAGTPMHRSSKPCRAARTLGVIRRALGKCDQKVKDLAYKQLVRPQLEYASCAWSPHVQKMLTSLRAFNVGLPDLSFMTKGENPVWPLCFHPLAGTPCKTDASLVSVRCSTKSIIIMHVNITVPLELCPSSGMSRPQRSQYSRHNLKYNQPFCRVNCYMYSMFPRSIRIWNTLPNNAVTSSSLAGFRGAALPIIRDMLPPPGLKML